MPDKPSRSVFVPLLIVGVVIVGLVLFLALVPLAGCVSCNGKGHLWGDVSIVGFAPAGGVDTSPASRELLQEIADSVNRCGQCEGKGKVPLLNIWRRETEETP